MLQESSSTRIASPPLTDWSSDFCPLFNKQIKLWFTEAEINSWGHHSAAWVYEDDEPSAKASNEGGSTKASAQQTVGKTIHAPFPALKDPEKANE